MVMIRASGEASLAASMLLVHTCYFGLRCLNARVRCGALIFGHRHVPLAVQRACLAAPNYSHVSWRLIRMDACVGALEIWRNCPAHLALTVYSIPFCSGSASAEAQAATGLRQYAALASPAAGATAGAASKLKSGTGECE